MIGQNLAHYRITGELGSGGMGEVYRATDTKLDREKRLKALVLDLRGNPGGLLDQAAKVADRFLDRRLEFTKKPRPGSRCFRVDEVARGVW